MPYCFNVLKAKIKQDNSGNKKNGMLFQTENQGDQECLFYFQHINYTSQKRKNIF